MQYSAIDFSVKNESNQSTVEPKYTEYTEYTENNLVLTVDSSQTYQEIQGFGGAMTDATALNIKKLSNGTQQVLLEYVIGIINY